MTYDPADNAAKSYALAIEECRKKLESFHRVQIGECTLYMADCREVLPLLPKVDAVVTDPPYGIGFPYSTYEDTRENLRGLISGVFAHREKFGRVVALCGPSQVHEYPPSDWVGAITWNTTGSFGKFGYSQWTPVPLYGEDLPGFGNVNGITKTDTYQINGGAAVGFQRTKTEAQHSCPKPVNIMLRMVQRYTGDSETILDPFMGSGTTGVAAVKLGRRFIGIEIDPGYFETACERIRDAYAQPDMFVEQEKQTKPEQLSLIGAAE